MVYVYNLVEDMVNVSINTSAIKSVIVSIKGRFLSGRLLVRNTCILVQVGCSRGRFLGIN